MHARLLCPFREEWKSFFVVCVTTIDVKKTFLRFYFGHVFTFFNVFFIFQTFFYLKNVSKVQSGKQINRKHFGGVAQW